MEENKIVIYQTEDGQTQIDVRLENETVWLNTSQMSALFEREESNVRRHIINVFKEGELNKEEVCAKFAHTTRHGAIEGKQQIQEIVLYNLDVIISVGYRVKRFQAPGRQHPRSPDLDDCREQDGREGCDGEGCCESD